MAKKVQEPKRPMHITIVLDETGSMADIRDATIEGFNGYIAKQQVELKKRKVTVTLVQFNAGSAHINGKVDGGIRTIFNGALADVPTLTTSNYQPDYATPLYDAVGRGIRDTEKMVDANTDVMVVVLTDGHENQSKEFSKSQITAMFQQKEADGWVFGFIGAGVDAWAIGAGVGLSNQQGALSVGHGAQGMSAAYVGLSAATSNYADDPAAVKRRGLFSK